MAPQRLKTRKKSHGYKLVAPEGFDPYAPPWPQVDAAFACEGADAAQRIVLDVHGIRVDG